GLETFAVSQVAAGQSVDLGDLLRREIAEGSPQLDHLRTRHAVHDPGPVTIAFEQPSPGHGPEVMRRVGDALSDLGRQLLDRPGPLGEDVQDLHPASAAEGLGHRAESVEELALGGPASVPTWHDGA